MIKKSFLQILFFFLAGIISVYGQQNNYQLANQLMQQQKYEEALPILQNLHEDNPDAFVFFDRYIDCLINLTDYEKAEQVARENLNSQRNIDETALKLAEILHLKGIKMRQNCSGSKFWIETEIIFKCFTKQLHQ